MKVCTKCKVDRPNRAFRRIGGQLSKCCRICLTFQKDWAADRRRRGFCTTCGAKMATEGPNRRDQGLRCSRCRANRMAHQRRLKQEVMDAYGGKCACCGESHIEFLSIDHILPVPAGVILGRNEKRGKKGPRSGSQLYKYLKRHGFPSGFRVLCLNCNFSWGHYGECPHKEGVREATCF